MIRHVLLRALGVVAALVRGTALGVVTTAGVLAVGVAINGGFALYATMALERAPELATAGGVGPFSWGFLFLLVVLGLPIPYLLIGQAAGARVATGHLYRSHRREILGWAARTLAAPDDEAARAEIAEVIRSRELLARLEEAPAPVRTVLRHALRRVPGDWSGALDPEYAELGFGPAGAAAAAAVDTAVQRATRADVGLALAALLTGNLLVLALIAFAAGLVP